MLSIEQDCSTGTIKTTKDKRQAKKYRNWAFTYFLPVNLYSYIIHEEKQKIIMSGFTRIIDYYFSETLFKYLDGSDFIEQIRRYVIGLEKCPSTGRLHFQGCIFLKGPVSFNNIRSHFPKETHIQECKKGDEANEKYCKKDGEYIVYGEEKNKGKGKRNDILLALDDNKSLTEFISAEPTLYVKYRSGIEGYYRNKGISYYPIGYKPLVFYLFGDTGTGKSRIAKEYVRERTKDNFRCWRRPINSNGWFDGYNGQEIVFLDEVRFDTFKFHDLLQMLDYDAPQVPVKGGFVDWKPLIIIMTSNSSPSELYQYINKENKEQLIRRCDYIFKVDKYDKDLLFKDHSEYKKDEWRGDSLCNRSRVPRKRKTPHYLDTVEEE